MATSMFSTFTAADRRKKVVTYSKSSRLLTIPATVSATNEDAPSPERARKHITASNGSLKKLGGTLKSGRSPGDAHANTGGSDVFDVPSEDEFQLRSIKPVKKLPAKHRTPEENFDIPLSDSEFPIRNRKPGKAIQPLRKPELVRAPAPTAQKLQPARLPKPAQVPPLSSDDPIAPQIQRDTALQSTQKAKQAQKNAKVVQQTKTLVRAPSRGITPALSAPKAQKNVKAPDLVPSRAASANLAAKKTQDLDVFDVPSSDEEALLSNQRPSHQVPAGKAVVPAKISKVTTDKPTKDSSESDDSSASKKRKRQGSISSVSTAKPTIERKREPSVPQRSRKYQRKADSVSPGHKSQDQPAIAPTLKAPPAVPAINKPRRTRLRTVPVLARPTIAKGQSSPATLNSMLPARRLSKPSPVPESPEVTATEDETMYEISDPLATPIHATRTAMSGSVTPRQKALFSSLLGESSSSATPMPSISALQLTDRKPRTLLGALSRSKSDLTYSAQLRKTRLIDTLKHTETSSEEDDSASDIGEEPCERNIDRGVIESVPKDTRTCRRSDDVPSDGMDVDVAVTAESQTSQAISGFGIRSRLTYAKSRSYLQEANPEDALLISMDLEDGLGFESQKKDGWSEDDEDPTSQVRANHELKRRGQQTKFNDEARMLIDDISIKTSKSIRRNAMLELCTKMADATFVGQLLDSSLAHQFFRDIASNAEVIFDFATAVAIVFIIGINPTYTVLDQIYRPDILATLVKMAGDDADVRRLAKDRKSNLSKIAQESVESFRTLVQDSSIWSSGKPDRISPQLVALKALESLVVGLRRAGNTESLLDQEKTTKLVDIALKASERTQQCDKISTTDTSTLDMILSILEAESVLRQKQSTWSTQTLERLAEVVPVFFQRDASTSTMLAVKLCMNLTNNKPKACQPFSGRTFVRTLVASIKHNFGLINAGLEQEQRTAVVETLILSLGAMINLAEFNDEARLNVDDGGQMLDALVEIFLEGSERAAQANSMEESHFGVAVGYLTVLLGNLCLNSSVRSKIRAQLPGGQLDTLIDKIKQFVGFHEHVDSKAKQFEEMEGQETWQNYTARLLLVVEKLEKAKN